MIWPCTQVPTRGFLLADGRTMHKQDEWTGRETIWCGNESSSGPEGHRIGGPREGRNFQEYSRRNRSRSSSSASCFSIQGIAGTPAAMKESTKGPPHKKAGFRRLGGRGVQKAPPSPPKRRPRFSPGDPPSKPSPLPRRPELAIFEGDIPFSAIGESIIAPN